MLSDLWPSPLSPPPAELPKDCPHLSLHFIQPLERPQSSFPGPDVGNFLGLGLERKLSGSQWLRELASQHESSKLEVWAGHAEGVAGVAKCFLGTMSRACFHLLFSALTAVGDE